MSYFTDLQRHCDALLIEHHMTPQLKASIRTLVAAGQSKRKILAFVRCVAGGRRPVVLACEAFMEQLNRESN